jgi:hypothetical protein
MVIFFHPMLVVFDILFLSRLAMKRNNHDTILASLASPNVPAHS